ncbi:hypothetical protein AAW51_4234 [Caldimonas brevitalea]|uniref:HTH OST-type domain-containing protein n=2 Tax=Caldimonas brevitalea TaxID=413882 RepID=A0A0G3BWK7_9BURK|nr:hypothetical protein AAW51_4234 [Caldimonas brevitalea]
MALFCDFENVALGVRDAKYDKFDIKRVLERLLLKGSIVVKKAYCDWDRYKGFKAAMHEANFELIEIPHVRQSGKNSADIRLVVDALDLCYTKSHVNTFVIISGDSDFSPLVSKLRENAKQVIGVGVKQSTSDLLIANCDEFIFYDDLVREGQRAAAKRSPQEAEPGPKRSPEEDRRRREETEARKSKAIEMALETFEALVSERGDSGKIWASVLKDAIKRRRPDFNESYFGFRTFGSLLDEAQSRGLLEVGRDEKSNTYVYRGHGGAPRGDTPAAPAVPSSGRRGRGNGRAAAPAAAANTAAPLGPVFPAAPDAETRAPAVEPPRPPEAAGTSASAEAAPTAVEAPPAASKRRTGRKTAGKKTSAAREQPSTDETPAAPMPAVEPEAPPAPQAEAAPPARAAAKRASRKTSTRARRPQKAEEGAGE